LFNIWINQIWANWRVIVPSIPFEIVVENGHYNFVLDKRQFF
jgi:hypothetical protein